MNKNILPNYYNQIFTCKNRDGKCEYLFVPNKEGWKLKYFRVSEETKWHNITISYFFANNIEIPLTISKIFDNTFMKAHGITTVKTLTKEEAEETLANIFVEEI